MSWPDAVAAARGEMTIAEAKRRKLERATPSRPDAPIGLHSIALVLGISDERASERAKRPSFPKAAAKIGAHRVWLHSDIEARRSAPRRVRAREPCIWQEWEERLGVELVSPDGVVALGPSVADRLAVLEQVDGVRASSIDAEELARRLPVLAGYSGPAMLDEGGGAIRTRAAIEALTAKLGDSLVADEVISIRPTASGTVEVRTGGECSEHDRIVVCAGRGTARLARAAHEDGSLLDPSSLASLGERASHYVARALPGLHPEPVAYRHCWVTDLPWSTDGIAVWESEGAFFVAGHNLFKHAPWLGRALARAALGDGLACELRPAARLGEPS